MSRKRRRLLALTIGLTLLAAATALVLTAFDDNLVFFYSPSELASQAAAAAAPGRHIRIGGLVETASLVHNGPAVAFRLTDGKSAVAVVYRGSLPDLFREGQGAVAEGRLRPDGVFVASSVLAKHDENYMPPEVADALKKSGRWQPGDALAAGRQPQPGGAAPTP